MQTFVAICDQKFVFPEKVGQNSPKLLKTCYFLKPYIMPNLSISVKNLGEKR